MGSKPTSQSNSSSTYTPPAWATSAYQNTVGQAQNVASQPYTPYSGQLVAPVNSQQTTGINTINSAAGTQNPYNTSASNLLNSGSSAINPGTVGASQISQYESPYQQQVVNSTMAEINNQNQQQSASLTGNAVSAGAMGGDRAGVAQAALAGQQSLASNATLANLNNQNYQQALGEANTQQQAGIQTQEQTAANQLSAGSAYGNLGNTALNEQLGVGSAQTAAGTLQQQTSQASDTANYNQYLQQLSYPYQNLSWLSGIEGGLGSLAGGTTNSSQQQQSSSGLSSILGGVLGFGSLLIPGAQPAAAAGAGIFDVARGGRITDGTRRASGGGVNLGGAGGSVTPYSVTNEVAPGAGSWIPQASQIGGGGHSQPSAGGMGASGSSQQQGGGLTGALQTANQVSQLGKGIEGSSLGSSLGNFMQGINLNRGGVVNGYASGGAPSDDLDQDMLAAGAPASSLGLATSGSSNSLQDSLLGLRRGGSVRHYDDGGTVTPDGLLFDPNALGVPLASSANQGNGFGAAASPSNGNGTFAQILNAESGGQQFDANGQPLTSPKGAVGIAQVMPSTAPEAAADAGLAFDPEKYQNDASYNAALGQGYYQKLLGEFGTPDRAAAAYNAGPGAVSAALTKADKSGGSYLDYLPQETQAFVSKVMGGDSGGGPAGSLAYTDDGSSSSGGGLGAINAALNTSDSGDTSSAPASSGNPFMDGLGAIGHTLQNGLGSLANATGQQGGTGSGFGITDNERLGLLSAGLGMMAGNSMNPWQNIGQGGLQGVNAMQNAAKTQTEVGLQRAQTQQIQTDNQIKQQQLGLMMRALQNNEKIFSQHADNIASSAASGTPAPALPAALQTIPGSVAPVAPPSQGGAAPAVAAVPSVAPQKAVDPQYDPTRLRAAAENMSFANPQAAANYRAQAQAIESGTAMVKFQDGSWGFLPGINEAKAGVAGAEAAAKSGTEAQYDLVQVQPQAGGPTYYVPKSKLLQMQQDGQNVTPVGPGAGSPPGNGMDAAASANPAIASQPAFYALKQQQIATDEDTMTQQFQARQLSKQRLQTLGQIMQTYQPGAFSAEKADLVSGLRAAGFNVPDSVTANPAAFQEFIKNATANVFNDVKGMGGRVLVSEIAGLTKANANPELQPAAAAAIIGQGLGVINYEDQHFKDYVGWKQNNPNATTTMPFEMQWSQQHPVQQYVDAATKNIAYKGQAIPSRDKLVDGQAYMTARGAARWNASRGVFTPTASQ